MQVTMDAGYADLRVIATELRRALKDIASHNSAAVAQDSGQAVARRARATLEQFELLRDEDARQRGLA
jgi:hypothetical protein